MPGAKQPSGHSLPLPHESGPQQHGQSTAGEPVPPLPATNRNLNYLQELARSSTALLPPSAATASLPLPKKAAKKKKGIKAQSSNASLAACINSLSGAVPHGPSALSAWPSPASYSAAGLASFSTAGLTAPAASFSAAGLTASIPLSAFGSSAVRVAQGPGMAGGVKHTGPSLGSLNSFTPEVPGSASASTAPGPVNAALELSLLLTTLQSLANLPDEDDTIASSSHLAQAQLRDWLAQLQQHASMPANEPVRRCSWIPSYLFVALTVNVKLCKVVQVMSSMSIVGQVVLPCEGCTPVRILACSVHATYHVLSDYASSARCHALT